MRWMVVLFLTALLLPGINEAIAETGRIHVATLSGSVNPASSDYLQKAIAQSEEENALALIIELDTPGGLVVSTKDVIQAILNAKVPVVVYVSPRGGWAGSAGTFITLAGHVAAMAPGTSIGAAHPVGIAGTPKEEGEKEPERDYSMEKAENMLSAYIESIARERDRNVEWAAEAVRNSVAIGEDEALELNVIDLVAEDLEDLVKKLDGLEVNVAGEKKILQLGDVKVVEIPMTRMTSFFSALASPDVAVLLIIAGVIGLYIEFQQPGMTIPGIVGAVCLVLGAISLQILPFQWVGLLLMLLGVGFFVAELFVTSFGVLFAIGVLCFLGGGAMLFDVPEASDLTVSFWEVLVPAVVGLSLFAGLVLYSVASSMSKKAVAGVEELCGSLGKVVVPLNPEGTVFIHGEYWTASSEEPVAEGEQVEVLEVEGLSLKVRSVRREIES